MIHPGQRMQQPAEEAPGHAHLLVREGRLRQDDKRKPEKRHATQRHC
jgi:hypothetical protein